MAESHDAYGRMILMAAAGKYFDGSRGACHIDYGGPSHTGGFIDGTVAGTIAVEVESRTAKQIRGAVLDLICHEHPKKLLLILRVHAQNPDLAAAQCASALRRFLDPENYRVLVLDGRGGEPQLAVDTAATKRALLELGMPPTFSENHAPPRRVATTSGITSGARVRNKPVTGTVLDQVRVFVESRSPNAVCDDCIAKRVGLSVRQHANHETRKLAAEPGFHRAKGRCSLCLSDKTVIRDKQ